MMKLSAVFTLIDKFVAPAKKIDAMTDKLGKGFGKAGDFAKNMGGKVGVMKSRLDQYSGSATKAAKTSRAFGNAVKWAAGIAATAGIVGFIKGFIDVGAKFEQYQTTLETVLGSQAKAKAAMAWVQNFAKTTPYELDEVTAAFVKLNAYGIDATDGTLRKLGDAASGMGKDLDSAIEMIADAQTMQFERLKEFGIQANQQGQKVVLTYHHAGKELTKTVRKNGQEIKAALLDIFAGNFAGAMDRQSKTLSGILSNIKDTWTGFQKSADDQGVFDKLKAKLGGFLNWLGDPKNASKIKDWETKFSDALSHLLDSFVTLATSIDWPTLINDFAGLIDNVSKFIDKMGGFKTIVDIGIAAWIGSLVIGLTGLTPIIQGVALAFFEFELAAWPVTLVVVAVAALAAIAFLVWRNWDTVKKWFLGFWGWMKEHMPLIPMLLQPFIDATKLLGGLAKLIIDHWDEISSTVSKAIDGIVSAWNRIPAPLQKLLAFGYQTFTPGGFLFNFGDSKPGSSPSGPKAAGSGVRLAPPVPSLAGLKTQQLKGQIDVKISQDGRARVAGVQSSTPGVDFNAYTGMQGIF